MSKITLRTRQTQKGIRVTTVCRGSQPNGKGRTKVQFKQDCDVNRIMARFQKTGELPQRGNPQKPLYGDFTQVGTFQESLNIVAEAQAQFQALPSRVRARFQNDPATFLEFCGKKENLPEMVKLGLATKRQLQDDAGQSTASNSPKAKKKAPAGDAGGEKPKKGADQ